MNMIFSSSKYRGHVMPVQRTPTQTKDINMVNMANHNIGRQIISSPAVKPTPSPVDTTKKVKWGQPTWFLLHTLCEKVNEEEFLQIRVSLLNIIYTICVNLPCPDCASHAQTYLDGVNFNTIQSKDQLKKMMFEFHNAVNKRKGYPIYNYSELTDKYSKAVTVNIIHNFMQFYYVKSASIRMISNDIFRARMVEKIKSWFNENIRYFAL